MMGMGEPLLNFTPVVDAMNLMMDDNAYGLSKRKVTLSMKLLEEIEKKEALEKYGSEGSGKNLPFSSLSEDLKKKEDEKE